MTICVISELFPSRTVGSNGKRKHDDHKQSKFSKKPRTDKVEGRKKKTDSEAEKAPKKQQKVFTEVDKMRRSKVRREKRLTAKRKGKRANKPRKC